MEAMVAIRRRYLRDADIQALAICKTGANRQRIFLLKEGDREERVARVAEIIKEPGADWRIAYVPVAVPGSEEDPGMFGEPGTTDVWESPEEIERAAHRFMANGAKVIAKHFDEQAAEDVKLVESAVALADFSVGANVVKQGTWYVGLEFSGALREAVNRGEVDAVSIEGYATRVSKELSEPETTPSHEWLDGADLIAIEEIKAAVVKQDHPSSAHPNLDWSAAENWIDRLPKAMGRAFRRSWIYRAAKHLVFDQGMRRGRAFAVAINAAKRGCSTGDLNFPGRQSVNPKSRAEMCAAVALWTSMKAHARSTP